MAAAAAQEGVKPKSNTMKAMSPSKILGLFCAFAFTLAAAAHAADHWYQVTILAGDSTLEFTGTSSLDSAQVAKQVSGTELIMLENLREFNQPDESAPGTWVQVAGATKVFIVPKSVLFFHELSADPMTTNAAPAAAEPEKPAAAPEKEKAPAGKGKKK
jgi:hypothetical protein